MRPRSTQEKKRARRSEVPASHTSEPGTRTFKDQRSETAQLKAIQAQANATMQFGGDHYYWYRTDGGEWTKAGKFKSHAEATAWIKKNKKPLNIKDFGEGGKSSYK